ncbi:MAG: SCP2 sterol-binding domain-containing protein [Geminicoccaceae bacterium]
MNLQTLTADVRAQTSQLATFGHTLKFDLEDVGVIWVDARKDPPVVSNEDLDADCTLYFSGRALQEVMVAQTMSPVLAVTLGEISFEGSKDVGERFLALMPEGDDDDA